MHFSAQTPQRDKLSLSSWPSYKECNWCLCCEQHMICRQQKFLPPWCVSSPAVCCKNHGALQRRLCRIRPKPLWCLQRLWQQPWSLQTDSQGIFLSRDILDDKQLPKSIHQCVCHTSYHLLSSYKINIDSIMHHLSMWEESWHFQQQRSQHSALLYSWPGTQCARLLSQSQGSVKNTLFCSFICVCAWNLWLEHGVSSWVS